MCLGTDAPLETRLPRAACQARGKNRVVMAPGSQRPSTRHDCRAPADPSFLRTPALDGETVLSNVLIIL
jgi:hypothetical protein